LALDVADHLEHHADVIDGVPRELTAAYRAFRRAPRPDDGLDPGLLRAFPSFDDPRMGFNPAMSRRVLATDGAAAYLVPGDGVLALIDDWGGSVLGIDQALDGTGIGTSFLGTGRVRVQGLLPDGIDAVRIVRRNGDEIHVPVSEHLYAADVHAATSEELPAEVLFSDRGRERRLRVPGADDEILRLRSPSPPAH
jgi:hypothetical protein